MYAVFKWLQWLYPTKSGLGKVFLIIGKIHGETQIEQVLGKYFEGSGVTDQCCLYLVRWQTVTRHSFLAVSLLELNMQFKLNMRYKQNCKHDFETWIQQSAKPIALFKYWYRKLEFILEFLIFVRSIRNADMNLCIDNLLYWSRSFFMFDHSNYARLTTVHLTDLLKTKSGKLTSLLITKKRFIHCKLNK